MTAGSPCVPMPKSPARLNLGTDSMRAAKEPHAETLPGTRSAGRSGHPTCHTL